MHTYERPLIHMPGGVYRVGALAAGVGAVAAVLAAGAGASGFGAALSAGVAGAAFGAGDAVLFSLGGVVSGGVAA